MYYSLHSAYLNIRERKKIMLGLIMAEVLTPKLRSSPTEGRERGFSKRLPWLPHCVFPCKPCTASTETLNMSPKLQPYWRNKNKPIGRPVSYYQTSRASELSLVGIRGEETIWQKSEIKIERVPERERVWVSEWVRDWTRKGDAFLCRPAIFLEEEGEETQLWQFFSYYIFTL